MDFIGSIGSGAANNVCEDFGWRGRQRIPAVLTPGRENAKTILSPRNAAVGFRANEGPGGIVARLPAREQFMLVDVSHVIETGMITYRGLPAPLICDFLSREQSRSLYAAGTEFQIGKIEMVANTGTYLDAPFHRYANGKDVSEISLECLANLGGVVIPANLANGRAIPRDIFGDEELRGKAVLVRTGWDRHWRTDQYFEGHPFLTRDAAEYLVEAGAALVGIDSLNIDDTGDLTRPVHSILLAVGVPIVEHLRGLAQLPADGFRFFAVPVKVKGMGTFPVRAFGWVEERARPRARGPLPAVPFSRGYSHDGQGSPKESPQPW
jgi:kynurenine formamidase